MRATFLAIFASILVPASSSPHSDAGPNGKYSIVAQTRDHGGRRAASANYTQDGSVGFISGTSTTALATGVLKSGYIAQLAPDNPGAVLEVLSVVSRKTHGGSGSFDIDLPLTDPPGVECRTGGPGGTYRIVVTFATPVTVSGVSIMSIDGQASATQSVSGAMVTVDLTAVASAQTLGITLINVSNGVVAGDMFVPMGVLLGDTTGNGFVNAGDTLQTRSRSGQTTKAANFRSDVNADGFINSGDTLVVRSRAGTTLP